MFLVVHETTAKISFSLVFLINFKEKIISKIKENVIHVKVI